MTHPIPDAALDSDIAIIARKGSGKSYLARGLAERLLDLQRRLVVIDPLGAWWGLKASADGENAGYPVAVFGGEHGDMPLTAKMGEPLARLISGENLPCVIDTSLMRANEQGELAIDLFEGLFRFNKDALTIILEEADVFAPQNPSKDGYAARVLHEVDRIARRGRARGLRLISLTQRPARLHKDVLSQAAALVAMRLTSPHDRGAIEEWIKGNADASQAKEVMSSLATLSIGSGWVWAPDHDILERAQFPRIKTLDTSATPKAGEQRVKPKTLAQVDVEALRDAMMVTESNQEAPLPSRSASKAEIEAAENRGHQRGYNEGHKVGRDEGYRQASRTQMLRVVEGLVGAAMLNGVSDALEDAAARIKAIETDGKTQSAVQPEATPIRTSTVKRQAHSASVSDDGEMSPSSRKIVDVVVASYPLGVALQTAAKRAGISVKSSAFRKYLREASSSPRIQDRGDGRYVAIAAEEGISAPIGLSAFKERLPPAYARMLEALEKVRGDELNLDEISELSGVSRTSSGLTTGLRELVSLELIEKTANGWRISGDFL